MEQCRYDLWLRLHIYDPLLVVRQLRRTSANNVEKLGPIPPSPNYMLR